MIVKMFFINGIPFTFDELPFGHTWDEALCSVADENPCYSLELMYKAEPKVDCTGMNTMIAGEERPVANS